MVILLQAIRHLTKRKELNLHYITILFPKLQMTANLLLLLLYIRHTTGRSIQIQRLLGDGQTALRTV